MRSCFGRNIRPGYRSICKAVFKWMGLACLAFQVLLLARAAVQLPLVFVVTLGEVGAYSEAVKGIREQFPDAQILDARDEARIKEAFAQRPSAIAIAIGSRSAALLERVAAPQLVMIRSVLLEGDLGALPSKFKASVTIDMPPEALLSEVAKLFPGKTRIGVIQGPMQPDSYLRAFEQSARRHGLTMVAIPCPHSRDLLEAFLKLQSTADLVWCPPNPQLYNSTTLKPLLMASLTNRLPIIGFSQEFVQAGALFGGSADFVEVGRQTAALAMRLSRNEVVNLREDSRKFNFSYNQRVARMLGVKAVISEKADSQLVLIR